MPVVVWSPQMPNLGALVEGVSGLSFGLSARGPSASLGDRGLEARRVPEFKAREVSRAKDSFRNPARVVAWSDEARRPPVAMFGRRDTRHELDHLMRFGFWR